MQAKRDSNGLSDHHPNLVMVNGLGLDFQASFHEGQQVSSMPDSLDEIRIYRCGINESVKACGPPRRYHRCPH